jgi:hypothetical protein
LPCFIAQPNLTLQRDPQLWRPARPAQSMSKTDASLTMRWLVDRFEQTDCPPELQKQKARE